MPGTTSIFSKDDLARLKAVIADAEKYTSGEIRLFIEDTCAEEVLDRTAFIFSKLKMQDTKERNGVLLYIAVQSKKIAILGDAGINSKVPENFWDEIIGKLTQSFSEKKFMAGLEAALTDTGKVLGMHFPMAGADVNELPDDPVVNL